MTILPITLTKICPSVKGEKAIKVANALNEVCPSYGIDKPTIMHEFLANLLEESWEFGHFVESLNYRAVRLMEVWPSRFPTMAIAMQYANNPQKLANKVYGGRMGNIQPNDGWDFRGSGPIQLTGRDTMTMFTVYLNKRLGTKYTLQQVAEFLRTDMTIGMHSSCWFFAIYKKLIPFALTDNMKEVVKRINGGLTNFAQRNSYYNQCKKYIV